ncbi:MAG: SRPBCC family protein [Alphaproteobacteria bacterium]|nr:SRPBCC family protein [Alphaproteobacteria bacterium]
MLKKILLVFVVLILSFVGYVSTKPSEYRYERALVIAAPADVIFPFVNTQKEWEKWSPWADQDPDMKISYEGAESGVGSIVTWEGNSKVGKGSSTITESVPFDRVVFALDFVEPMAGKSTVTFTFSPTVEGTKVTWAMEGKAGFAAKAMSVIMDCGDICTSMMSKGLKKLAAVATADVAAKAAAIASEAAEAAKALDEKAEEAPAKE